MLCGKTGDVRYSSSVSTDTKIMEFVKEDAAIWEKSLTVSWY